MPQLAKPMGESTVTGWEDIGITTGNKEGGEGRGSVKHETHHVQ